MRLSIKSVAIAVALLSTPLTSACEPARVVETPSASDTRKIPSPPPDGYWIGSKVAIPPLTAMVYTCEQMPQLNPIWAGLPRGESLKPESGQFVLMSLTLWNNGRETVSWSGKNAVVATIPDGSKERNLEKATRGFVDPVVERLLRPEPKILFPGAVYQTHLVFDVAEGQRAVGVFLTPPGGLDMVFVNAPAS